VKIIMRSYRVTRWLTLSALFALLGWSCATRSYVQERTDEIQKMAQDNRAQIDRLMTDVSAAQDTAGMALGKADQALLRAMEAQGFGNYRILGEKEVNFDFDKYDLTKTAQDILDEIGMQMQEHPELILNVAGYTDNIGSETYNLLLGDRRAQSVRRYLTDKFGVGINRLFQISYGESDPKRLNDSSADRAANRRATLTLLGPSE
jgi:outer membrane protein OmpA-like peptidoglycan-associated protein